ncbi:TetR/AcrR family transcriptional regulator [soil metagenome]
MSKVDAKPKSSKLSSSDRRTAIVQAVRMVFAEKGFHGTTTRELAQAAGVSEALLFKHFPTKEALFSAMQLSCCQEHDLLRLEQLKAQEPSAETLVRLIHFLVSVIVRPGLRRNEEEAIPYRLMLRSLAEDGEFARLLLGLCLERLHPKLEECLRTATDAGDVVSGPVSSTLNTWFAHHLATMIMLLRLPEQPAVDYHVDNSEFVKQAVWFILRGMGVKDRVIEQHFDPQAFADQAN